MLQAAQHKEDGWVVLTNPVEPDGSPSETITNKIVLFVVSLQNDASTGTFTAGPAGKNDAFAIGAPPLVVDAYFLVTANFTGVNYPTGLDMISRVISYFQGSPVFTHRDAPSLPPDVDKIIVEYTSLDFAQANNLLMLTGLKCFPFLLYRIRRLAFTDGAIQGVAPPVRGTGPAAGVRAA